jgi:hypothetical protein
MINKHIKKRKRNVLTVDYRSLVFLSSDTQWYISVYTYCKTFHHKLETADKRSYQQRKKKYIEIINIKKEKKKKIHVFLYVYEWRRKTNVFMYVRRQKKKKTYSFVRIYNLEKEKKKKRWLIWIICCSNGGCNRGISVRTPSFVIIKWKNLPLKFFSTNMINLHSFVEQFPKIASLQIDT